MPVGRHKWISSALKYNVRELKANRPRFSVKYCTHSQEKWCLVYNFGPIPLIPTLAKKCAVLHKIVGDFNTAWKQLHNKSKNNLDIFIGNMGQIRSFYSIMHLNLCFVFFVDVIAIIAISYAYICSLRKCQKKNPF